ncbi:e3 ubiquitin-protein ligase MARCH3 [Nephila pilipes]|uniref:E3 ubiquitin-protein ligase MARCH3 n=1 Tax=Nephila pilipes TaxID=299642 RepID=A0A8X6UPJ0_NEPPI|nr:e3 ubiquitin-protein ligase MARCH3 [Nephila pilipes]
MEKQSDRGYGTAKPQNSDMASSQEQKESSAPKSSSNDPVLLKVSDLENNPMCRICYNGPSRERLVRPCKCKGTIEYVHRHCLERWLESTNCETCELCRYHFTTRKTRKYSEERLSFSFWTEVKLSSSPSLNWRVLLEIFSAVDGVSNSLPNAYLWVELSRSTNKHSSYPEPEQQN